MAATLTKDVLDDELAVSLARAVAAANGRARQEGIEIQSSLVTVTEQGNEGDLRWCVNYGPRNCVGRRGGDLIVEVGFADAEVKRVLRGQ